MGKTDITQTDYLDDDRRFADLINGVLYGGEQVVLPQELEEADGELHFVWNNTVKKTVRDKVKKWKKEDVLFTILTVENQNYVDYAMVLRSMLMEAMGYHKQWKQKKRGHDSAKDLSGRHEFLSGIKKDEVFTPIIPLVVYYGVDKAWDGPRTMHELLGVQDKKVTQFVNDYKLNLFDFHEQESFQEFQTELRTLFEFLRYSGDEKTIERIIHEHESRYSSLDEETANLMTVLTNIREWKKIEQFVKQDKDGRSVVDMCKAWDDHKKEGIKEGISMVITAMLRNNMSLEDIHICTGIPFDKLEHVVKEVHQKA